MTQGLWKKGLRFGTHMSLNLFMMNCAKERELKIQSRVQVSSNATSPERRQTMKRKYIICKKCGARMLVPENETLTECPVCGAKLERAAT